MKSTTTSKMLSLFSATASLVSLLALPLNAASTTDVTFAFTADIHSSFNGTDDAPGLFWSFRRYPTNDTLNMYYWLLKHETYTQPGHDGCQIPGQPSVLGGVMDLCNQIQLVRKLNALPLNTWPTPFSYGQSIAPPKGLLIGGDLTLCAEATVGADCGTPGDKYYGNPTSQLGAFAALFDRDVFNSYTGTFAAQSFLSGLNIGQELPLHYAIYPGLGNHDRSDDSIYKYILNWGINANYANGDRKVTNRDDKTGSYSMDWGNVHIISAGIYAGAGSDSNYGYSADSMQWFKDDLAKYASDGRPVVIYQHFGFDGYSLGTGWYLGPTRSAGYLSLWQALANYNVIGIFAGHSHGQSVPYQFPETSKLTASQATFGLSTSSTDNFVPYDIFLPGPGYLQDFAVARITDSTFEVAQTDAGWDPQFGQPTDDYDGSGHVNLHSALAKQLVSPPKAIGAMAPVGLTPTQLFSLMTADRRRFVITVDSTGNYTVWSVDQNKTPQNLLQQGVGLTGAVQEYFDADSGETRVLAVNSTSATAYRINIDNSGNVTLQKLWTSPTNSGSGFLTFNAGDQAAVTAAQITGTSLPSATPYLIIDQPGSQFSIYRLTATGLQLVDTLYPDPAFPPGDGQNGITHLLPMTIRNNGRQSNGFIRFYSHCTSPVNAEFYSIDDTQASQGLFTFRVLKRERWPANYSVTPVRMPDGSVRVILKNPGTDFKANTFYPQSPWHIRTVHADGSGSDVSWRGLMAPTDVKAIVSLGYTGTQADLGMLNTSGQLLRYRMP